MTCAAQNGNGTQTCIGTHNPESRRSDALNTTLTCSGPSESRLSVARSPLVLFVMFRTNKYVLIQYTSTYNIYIFLYIPISDVVNITKTADTKRIEIRNHNAPISSHVRTSPHSRIIVALRQRQMTGNQHCTQEHHQTPLTGTCTILHTRTV